MYLANFSKNILHNIKILSFHFHGYRKQFTLLIVLDLIGDFFLGVSMLLFIPLISTSVNYHSAGFIQKVVIKGFNYLGVGFSLRNIMLFILVFVVFKSIFLFLSEVYSVYFVNKYKVNTTNKMFSAYQDIDWRFAITQDQGYLMNYILNIPDKNANLLLQLISGISTIISILIFIIFSLVISIGLTVLTLSFMVLSGIVYLYFLSKIKKCGYQGFKLTHELFKMVAQYIRGNKAVRSFDVRDAVKKYVDNTTRKRMDNIIGLNLLEISYVSITRVMLALAVFAILFLFIELLGYPIGEVIVVCIFFVKIVQKEKNIRTFSKVARYLPSLERLDVLYLKFLKHKNERCVSGYRINTFENSIEFKDVNYSYEIGPQKKYEKEDHSIDVKEKNCLHIKGINLKIKKGNTVVIVGASGAGKTTLLDLLMGLIEPVSGEIIIDKIPLTEINLSSWRRLIGYVSQASFLLNDTIYNNIVFQRKISKKDVEKAANMANCYDFIDGLDNGFGAIVGEDGVNLSGGQCQRICIARALAGKPEILILDEAASSIDPKSENYLHQTIKKLEKNITIILVSHRVPTAIDAEKIVVVEKGEIVDIGSGEQLRIRERDV